MNKEEMTIHEALCELKTLDSRIEKAINGGVFVFANKHSNTKVSGVDIGDYCQEIESRFQSIVDLMHRRDAIKRAVTLSNAKTTVTIGDKTYTIAEAIDMKNHSIPLRAKLLAKLNADRNMARVLADRDNGDKLETRASEHVKLLYGESDMKGATEEARKAREAFITAQTTEVVDPINSTKRMEELSKNIDNFMVKIDSALSVSNATTTIEVVY